MENIVSGEVNVYQALYLHAEFINRFVITEETFFHLRDGSILLYQFFPDGQFGEVLKVLLIYCDLPEINMSVEASSYSMYLIVDDQPLPCLASLQPRPMKS